MLVVDATDCCLSDSFCNIVEDSSSMGVDDPRSKDAEIVGVLFVELAGISATEVKVETSFVDSAVAMVEVLKVSSCTTEEL